MKKVLILSCEFPPQGGPGVQRMAWFTRYLPQYGWEPVVLAAEPDPKKPRDEELLDTAGAGLHIHRFQAARLPAFLDVRVVRALLRAFILPDRNRIWAQRALPTARKLLAEGSFSAILSTDPAGAHWLGWKLKQEFGIPWVMDIRDLWTGAFTYRPVSVLHALLDSRYERQFLALADSIVCVTAGYPEVLQAQHPSVPPEKYVVIPNGYDEEDFKDAMVGQQDRFRISYVGSVYAFKVRPRPAGWKRLLEPFVSGGPAVPVRSPRAVLQAVRILLDRKPEAREFVRLRFVGSFPDEYLWMIDEAHLADLVEITGYLGHTAAVAEMRQAAVLLLVQDGDGSEVVIPGKLYEYLRSGSAVLGMLREGLAAQLIRDSAAGNVVEPGCAQEAADLLEQWYTRWKNSDPLTNPDRMFIRNFTRRHQTELLAGLLNGMIRHGDEV